MLTIETSIEQVKLLAKAGRHAELVEMLGSGDASEIEASPLLALLYGTSLGRVGRHAQGAEWVEKALQVARRGGEETLETRALNARGAIAFVSGEIDNAADFFTQSMMAASRDEDHTMIGRCSNNIGSINSLRGRIEEAISSYTMAIAAFDRAGYHRGVAEARHNLGVTYLQRHDHPNALEELDAALVAAVLAGDRALVGMAHRGRAEAHVVAGSLDKAAQDIGRALDIHRELGDSTEEVEDLRVLALVQAGEGELDVACASLREIIARAGITHRLHVRAEATRDLAYVLRRMGNDDEATKAARTAVQEFERLGAEAEIRKLDGTAWGYPLVSDLRKALEPLHEAQRLANAGEFAKLVDYLEKRSRRELEESPPLSLLCGIGQARLGRLETGQQWVLIAQMRARVMGDRATEVRALNVYGAIALERGGIEEARHFFMKAQAEAMQDGDLASVGRCANNLGIVANLEGDYGRALGAYTTAMAAYQRAGFDPGVIECHHNLGITHRDSGNLSEAMSCADQAVESALTFGDAALKGQTLAGRAEIRTVAGDHKLAIVEAQRALTLHHDLGDSVRESEDLRILAGALAGDGQLAEAEVMLRDVVKRATDQSRPVLVATAQRDLAFLLDRRGRMHEADEMARDATVAFDRLGAMVQVEKLKVFLERANGSRT